MATRLRRVVWTPRARDGLEKALEYVAKDSPRAAEKILEVVLGTAHSLTHLSDRGRVVPELRVATIREVFVFSYRLIYEVREDEVRILAFLHGARDFDRWLKE
ncbi:MAG: type II toxin-antitoxin system RelE/ParE family toxin [Planctomycetota bacterium]